MSETKPNQTWITSKSIAIAARIPHNLYHQIEAYGMTHFAKGEDKYDKTATIIDLITKGLGFDSVSQVVQQSVNQQSVEQLVQQTVRQELEKTVNQNDIQNVKQELLESVKQLVSQSVNQSPESLEDAISHHPTIQEMQAHIMKLDSYLDGLTKAIQEIMEVKAVSDPIPDDVPQLDSTFTSEVTLISSEGKEIITPESLRSSDTPSTPSEHNDLNPIDSDTTEAMSDNEETQRFTDKEVQAILKQKYNIRTTPQTLSKWRLKQTQPRGRNQIIFDHFKPDGDRWRSLQ
ncbi:MAG: hypothetical protein AB4063_11395 [Crocosphaera sp.]